MSDAPYIDPNDSFANQPKPWSGVAIAAFVTAFLVAPVGILLGIIGIFHTSKGRRRGMGLSIAAIPVGIIVSVLIAAFVGSIYVVMLTRNTSRSSLDVLRTSQVRVAESTSEFYEKFASKRLKANVDEATFSAWLGKVVAEHGSLQRYATPPLWMEPHGQEVQFNFDGEFVNGSARISVVAAVTNEMNVEIDDIEVDGVSVTESAGQEADGTADTDGE